jgi:serine/threonine-protein kinase/endoribonuclease IRE1
MYAGLGIAAHHDPASLIALGREDFIVRSLTPGGTETWNATFARVLQLPASEVPAVGGSLAGPQPEAGLPPAASGAVPLLSISPDNTLKAFCPNTGFRRWSLPLSSVPVAAFSPATGGAGVNHLDPGSVTHMMAGTSSAQEGAAKQAGGKYVPAVGQGSSVPPPSSTQSALLPWTKGSESNDSQGYSSNAHVLVGRVAGSLYALPTDRILMDTSLLEPYMAADYALSQPLPALAPGQQPAASDGSAEVCQPEDSCGVLCTGAAKDGGICAPDDEQEAPSSNSQQLVPYTPGSHALVVQPGDEGSQTCPLGLHALAPPLPHRRPASNRSHHLVPWLPVPHPRADTPARPLPPLPRPPGLAGDAAASAARGLGMLSLAVSSALGALVMVAVAAVVLSSRWRAALLLRLRRAADALEEQYQGALAGDASRAGDLGAVGSSLQRPIQVMQGQQKGRASNGRVANGLKDGSSPKAARAAAQGRRSRVANGRHAADDGLDAGDSASTSDSSGDQAAGAGASSSPRDRQLGQGSEPGIASAGAGATSQGGAATGHEDSRVKAPAAAVPFAGSRSRVLPGGAISIGRLRVGPGILGYGSAGTIVYEGSLDGRPVAVKRLLRQFYDLARKEIEVRSQCLSCIRLALAQTCRCLTPV